MKLRVMYRDQCVAAAGGYGPEYNTENITEPTLIISIFGSDDTPPMELLEAAKENHDIIHIEFLEFDDIDGYSKNKKLKPMTDKDADTIIRAVSQYNDRITQIIVHCNAGYSRSPAVAAAIALYLGQDDTDFFGNNYRANKYVYEMMLDAINRKKAKNVQHRVSLNAITKGVKNVSKQIRNHLRLQR